jgi:calcium-dependent protein kinase
VGLKELYGDDARTQAKHIFDTVDIDGSGFIDYSEWVVATINKQKLLTNEILWNAFQLFDKDGGGTISA